MTIDAQIEIMNNLRKFGAVPVNNATINEAFTGYSFPNDKILDLTQAGVLLRLKRGLYIVSPQITNEPVEKNLIANYLHGPSYVSLQTALYSYGLIPEAPVTITSVTAKRPKTISNRVGVFRYEHVKNEYYHIGIKAVISESSSYMIASREKAVCDLLILLRNFRVQSKKAMMELLSEDMRLDMGQLREFEPGIIEACIACGTKKKELSFLKEIIDDYK